MVKKKKPPVEKDPRANALCDEIRRMYFTKGPGWFARPRHQYKQIVIGHPEYGADEEVSCEIDSLHTTLDRLGLADLIGYTIVVST